MIQDFILNIALLLILAFVYGVFAYLPGQSRLVNRSLLGLWFGLIAVAGMLMPFVYSEGAIFDGRSVILALAGLYGGWLPALISAVIAGSYRIFLGGAGMWAGLATIVFCSMAGLFFRWRYANQPERIDLLSLYGIGVLVHLIMLACQLLFPWPTGLAIISRIWLPVMLLFPLAFVIIGQTLGGIGRRIKAEQETREAESRYRALFNSIRDAILVADTRRFITHCNPAFTDLFGYTLQEIRGKKTLTIYKNEDQFRALGQAITEEDGARPILHTVDYQKKDGTVFPGETAVFLQKDSAGKVSGFIGLIRDVSDRMLAETTMRISEKKYRMAFKTIPDALSINRLSDGLFIEINESFTRTIGYAPEEIIGKTAGEVEIWADPSDRNKLVDGLKKHGHVEGLEARFRMKDGKIVHGLMSAAFISLNGELHILSITRDHSERKRAEMELRKLKDELEQKVDEKTSELQERVRELERFRQATIDRELRIKELRDEIKRLKGNKQ
ncbi:MAG: PAS domain S-box protein [Bacteroidales bacterium]